MKCLPGRSGDARPKKGDTWHHGADESPATARYSFLPDGSKRDHVPVLGQILYGKEDHPFGRIDLLG